VFGVTLNLAQSISQSINHGCPQNFFQGEGKFREAKKLATFFLVVTLKTQVFTVTINAQNTLQYFQRGKCPQNISFFRKGACVRRRGACAMAQWHIGTKTFQLLFKDNGGPHTTGHPDYT